MYQAASHPGKALRTVEFLSFLAGFSTCVWIIYIIPTSINMAINYYKF